MGMMMATMTMTTHTSVQPGAIGLEGSAVLLEFTRMVHVARIMGGNPTKDVAMPKMDYVGTSMGLRVRQGSLAIGNLFGLDHTLT